MPSDFDPGEFREENKSLADSVDIHSDVTKIIEDENSESIASLHSVYSPTTAVLTYQPRQGFARYRPSLKHLLPIRVNSGPGSSMPVDQSGCFSFILFSWLTPLIWRGFKKGLKTDDLYQCSPFESAKVNGARLSAIWDKLQKERVSPHASFRLVLTNFICTRFTVACIAYLFCLIFGFVGPTLFMRMLLEYAESLDGDLLEGLLWVLGLILCEVMRVLCFVSLWSVNCRTAVRTNAGLASLLYRKMINLRSTSGKTTGELVNLFSNDGNKIMMMVYTAPLIIGGPLVMTAAIIYTWWLLGPYALVGVAVFVLAYALQFGISKVNSHYRKKAIKITDERISLMTEILTYIRLIKLYAWERSFSQRISEARKEERSFLECCQFMQTISTSTAVLIPIISTICTILAYTMAGHDLSAAQAFTLMMVNVVTSHGLRTLPLCVRDFVNGFVAIQRLESFLQLDERDSYVMLPSKPGVAAFVSKAFLSWPQTPTSPDPKITASVNSANLDSDSDDKLALVTSLDYPQPNLKDITFTLQKGKLVGVCGPIGCGKSSLLSALLGQMHLIGGHVSARSSCAYVAQQPWILNTSVRENILFGEPFNSKRYYEAVYCCSLTDDLAALPRGDLTQIGERGMTLSGGQRQRVSLARAIYANRELNLLDDPLSAVDPKVANHMFHHGIRGTGKSILFVTNQPQFLKQCDSVIFMRDGRIMDEGPHDTLMSIDSEYAHFVSTLGPEDNNISNEEDVAEPLSQNRNSKFERSRSPSHPKSITSLASSLSDSVDDNLAAGTLIVDEPIASGEVSCDTYRTYICAAGGYIVCSTVLVWFVLQACTVAFSSWWLSHWISQCFQRDVEGNPMEPIKIMEVPDVETYQLVYGCTIAGMLVVSLILGFLYIKSTFRASSRLHDNVLTKILQCPMQIFETVPVGRILNIFTRDLDQVDVQLPTLMDTFLQQLMGIIFIIILMSYSFVWFYLAFGAMAFLFYFLHRMFRSSLRDFKRMENVSRSPIYSHIGSTVQGMATIRAYQKQDMFIDIFSQLVDRNSSPMYLYYCSLRWLAARMDVLCLVITLLAALLACCLKEHIGPAYSGLAIVLAMQLSGCLQYMVRVGCDVETHFTSVERIQYYIENMESEAPAVLSNNRAPNDWPTRGRISFREVNMRYRAGLPLALKNVTFDISPQEKIGIVGRTGAGKSSLSAALFRLVELSSGTIHIDGLDVSQLGLEDLRSRMSIIPQDPILFCGTLRHNLDPLTHYNESQLWDALEKTNLKEKGLVPQCGLFFRDVAVFIEGLPYNVSCLHQTANFCQITLMKGALNTAVEDNGENFSVGERQLICLARALLRKNKIVMLDEATASVDQETDVLIQNTVKDVFAECTVLIIAHRLNTVLHCDRIMVLDNGKVVEFDNPVVLLANPKSKLAKMYEMTKV